MEKSPELEGLGIHFNGLHNEEFEEQTLLKKLPFGLKWFKIVTYELETDNLSSLFSSEAMKTLQDFSIEAAISVTDLPMFSAPELVKFGYIRYFTTPIPDEILRSLAMYSTKLKEVSFTVPVRTAGRAVYFPLRGLEKVFIGEASDELIEILCRNNGNLQSIALEDVRGLTAVFMTHLATLEHLTKIRVITGQSGQLFTPTSLLSFLRNRASRPKNIRVRMGFIRSNIFRVESQQLVELRHEIDRQKLEDGSFISISFMDKIGYQALQ